MLFGNIKSQNALALKDKLLIPKWDLDLCSRRWLRDMLWRRKMRRGGLPNIPYKEGKQQQVSMGTKQEPHPHWSRREKQLMPHNRGERTALKQKCQPGLLLIPGFPTGLSKLGHTTVYKQSLCPLTTRIQPPTCHPGPSGTCLARGSHPLCRAR